MKSNQHFEFINRRVHTEAATGAAACRYDSAEDNQEEDELIQGSEFFDLDNLPDQMPKNLYIEN